MSAVSVPAYPQAIYSTFAFVGMVLALIPLPWHLQAWNTGTCMYMIWTAISCLNCFVNSMLFKGSVINVAPVWCDISTKIVIGVNFAVPACTLCINRRLYHIASVKTVTISREERRRGVMIDLIIALGIPLLGMVLSYIVQGHRFDIFEDIGCYPAMYNSSVSIALINVPTMLIAATSGVYSTLSIRAFWKTRNQLNSVLSTHNSCNTSRYTRLMLLAFVETSITLPLAIYICVRGVQHGLRPWISWADTHSNFSRVEQVPGVLWRGVEVGYDIELTRWMQILGPFIFFMFFGFAEEARKNYSRVVSSVTKHTGLASMTWGNFGSGTFGTSKGSSTEVNASNGVLPVYVKRDVQRKRDTFDSFSDMTASISDGSSFVEKVHDEKAGSVPDYENIVLPVPGGILTEDPISHNSSTASLPRLAVPEHTRGVRPDSGLIEISSIRDDLSPVKVSDESRV